tara:strand:- start:2194 stop:2568 length:375 start_codon:yes stop_codon:yes gene_type:complete
MSNQEIPPWLREQLARFEQLQQSLQVTSSQKQQIELEIAEMNKAVEELTKSGQDETVYKSVGTVLIKSKKEDVLKEIEEKKELSNTRLIVLSKQETRVRENVKELQAKINEAVKSRAQTQTPTS